MRLVRPLFSISQCFVSEIKSDVKSTGMYAFNFLKLLYHCLAVISPQQAFYALVHRHVHARDKTLIP